MLFDGKSLICWDIDAINVSMLCIWYLILFFAFLRIFESTIKNLDWSFLTATTIGDIKYLSGHFVSFVMCFSFSIFLSSELTLDCRLIELPLFFWCRGWKCLWNFDLATWFLVFEYEISDLRNEGLHFLLFAHCDKMIFTWLSLWEEDCLTASPSWSKRSRPMSGLRPLATTVEVEVGKLVCTSHCLLMGFEFHLQFGLIQ